MRTLAQLGLLAAVVVAAACSDQRAPTAPSQTPTGPTLHEADQGTWGEYAGDPTPPVTMIAAATAPPPGVIVNASFEDGGACDYTGWTLWEGGASTNPMFGTWGLATNGQTIPLGGVVFDHYDRIDVGQISPGLPHTYAATDGHCVALQLQRGSQSHRMYQEITIPARATMIDWDMEYSNHISAFVPGQQELAVTVRDPATDAILGYLFRTVPGDPLTVSTMTTFTGDVSGFRGQAVRLSVDMIVNNFYFDAAFDNFRFPTTLVDIDIKPGSWPNSINCRDGDGVITVAILTTDDFDAMTVDHRTVLFEGASELHLDKRTGEPRRHEEDVDMDGDVDLVFHFSYQATTLTCSSTEGTLDGAMFGGGLIRGTDAVRSVPAPAMRLLFDNGYSSGPQNNYGNTPATQRLFEDFTLGQRSVIATIRWQQHDYHQSAYLSTEVLVFAGLPYSGTPVYNAILVADRAPNATGTLFGTWEGYDYEISGLAMSLPAGTYWIGLNSSFLGFGSGWDNTTGTSSTILGFRVVNALNPAPGALIANSLAFSLHGR